MRAADENELLTSPKHPVPVLRCRSQAGGRPSCTNVSVKRYAIEKFVNDTLGEPESDDPDFMEGLRKIWQQLDQDERRCLLPRLLTKVVFNPDLGTVEIERNEH